MPQFVCNFCGGVFKRDQCERHISFGSCKDTDSFSCTDCNEDMRFVSLKGHTVCISEDQKYQGALYEKNEKNASNVNTAWSQHVIDILTAFKKPHPKIIPFLRMMREKHIKIVPRNRTKFRNFCFNSLHVRDETTFGLIEKYMFDSFSFKKEEKTEKVEIIPEVVIEKKAGKVSTKKFNWKRQISKLMNEQEENFSLEKIQKKITKLYKKHLKENDVSIDKSEMKNDVQENLNKVLNKLSKKANALPMKN